MSCTAACGPAVNAFVYPVFYVQLPVRDLAAADCGIFSVDRATCSASAAGSRPARRQPAAAVDRNLLREHGLPADGDIVLQTFRACSAMSSTRSASGTATTAAAR